MKSSTPSKIYESLFKQDAGEHPVRLIKADQVAKLLHGSATGHDTLNGNARAHKKPEIRMIHSGADYCDIEVICGCGESTQVRCWNTSPVQEKGAL
jgi:hypothetical protein